ncbi:MAG: ATP-binding cassette domain-containing protein [Verrucomicrobia bacterium]|nr:ATP-binding cassette domain-containing protein [Verrucomicrobiota bacterium]
MIRLANISWQAGAFRLQDVTFTVPDGAYGVLMGRTGCGKTSLLEILCGLRRPSTGQIWIGERDVTAELPGRRGIGYVPQDGALFPTLTVSEQIAFAPRRQKLAAAARVALVGELAAATGVAHLLDRWPAHLSGGERQRVALARALAARPAVLLLDEPLAALDEETHADMMALLKTTQQGRGLTVLHVTHHRHEATSLADCLLRMEDGQVSCCDGL